MLQLPEAFCRRASAATEGGLTTSETLKIDDESVRQREEDALREDDDQSRARNRQAKGAGVTVTERHGFGSCLVVVVVKGFAIDEEGQGRGGSS